MTQALFILALSPRNPTGQRSDTGIVRQSSPRDFKLGQRAFEIEIAPVKIFRACQVCFAGIRPQAKGSLDGGFGECQPRRRMVVEGSRSIA
jgi:hypothetical protein